MATRQDERIDRRTRDEFCTVMVLYEDVSARDLAFEVHDRLIDRFRGDVEFEFNWWRFDHLSDAAIAEEAALAAIQCDLFLVSLHQLHDAGPKLGEWFETWLPKRNSTDGGLAVIRVPSVAAAQAATEIVYLRSLALRANLDYIPLPIPSSASEALERLQKDGVLPVPRSSEGFPDHRHRSSGWGINE